MVCSGDEREEQVFSERLDAFFRGDTPERHGRDLSIGISDAERHQRKAAQIDAALAEIDRLMNDDDESQASTIAPTTATEAEEPTYERIDHAPVPTPYDRARQAVIDAEILRDVAEPGSDEYHEAMANLAVAKRALKTEQERATDDGWRKRRATDEWRAGEGREEYNASRRKVRGKSNARRLDMTPEDRAQHDADMNAKRVWMSKKRKAGWSAEKIEAELPGWWARRLAKRACA